MRWNLEGSRMANLWSDEQKSHQAIVKDKVAAPYGYVPVWETAALEGAEFDIIAAEDIGMYEILYEDIASGILSYDEYIEKKANGEDDDDKHGGGGSFK